MSEITELYENAGIKPKQKGYCDWGNYCPYPYNKCNDECPWWKYEDEVKHSPFTAEKQLKLVKWLIIEGYIEDMLTVQISEENFEACLADTFNELWQDLSEEEKQQVKGILE